MIDYQRIRPCVRCGVGVSGIRRYCAPCADIARIEAKAKQNHKRPKATPLPAGAVRYVGTKNGMMLCGDEMGLAPAAPVGSLDHPPARVIGGRGVTGGRGPGGGPPVRPVERGRSLGVGDGAARAAARRVVELVLRGGD